MFNFHYSRRAFRASTSGKVILTALFAGLVIASASVAGNLQSADSAGAAGMLACSGPASVSINSPATFTATGGDGNYRWSSNQSTGRGQSYTVSFPNPGRKTIALASGMEVANCTIQVTGGGSTVGVPGPNVPGKPVTDPSPWEPAPIDPTPVPKPPLATPAQQGCAPLQYGQIAASNGSRTARVTVTNPNPAGSNCNESVGLASYKAYVAWNGFNANAYLSGQQLLDNTAASLSGGQSRTLTVTLPSCNYQVDFFKGTQPKTPPFYGPELMTWVQEHNLGVCNDIPPPPVFHPVACAPATQTAAVNQTVSLSASGGDGVFSWSAPGGSPASGSGQNFPTSFSASGMKVVTVTSEGRSAQCYVNVQQVEIPVLTCAPGNQSANVNETVSFTAAGGTGSLTWTATGGSPNAGIGSNFSTRYSVAGVNTVTVRDTGGRTATCSVQVNQIQIQAPICNPSNQNATVGQSVNFNATGGNGTFAWSAGTGSPTTGNGSAFSTVFNNSGTHVVNVTSNGLTDSCLVNVQPVVINNLSCTASVSSANIGSYVSFSANGGTGSYSWNANTGNPTAGSGQNFTTQFNAQGTQTVSVTSGNQIATCNVVIIQNYFPTTPSCSPSTQNATVNQQVTLYGTGGTGNYSWNASNGFPNYGYGSNFSTSFPAPGLWTVTLNSNGQTAQCTVNVQQQNINNAPFCSPSSQNANVNDFVTFSATGGNGSYFWNTTADGSPTTGSGSSFGARFTTPGTKIVTVNSNGQTSQCIVQIGSVLGASTVVTGPEDAAAVALGLGFLGSLGVYGAVFRKNSKQLLAKAVARFRR